MRRYRPIPPSAAVAALAAGLAGLTLAGGAAGARTVMSISADATTYASAAEKRTVLMRPKDARVVVSFTATETVRPYTRDADYKRVYGPDLSRPVVDSDGSIYIECRRRGEQWFQSTDLRRTFRKGTTTVRLPLRRAYQCRFTLSVSANGDTLIGSEDMVATSLTTMLVVR